MSIFAKPTPAPTPRSKDVPRIALLFAAIILVMAVAQLFTFDKFLVLIQSFALPVTAQLSYILAALIVIFEVFSLPFLLRMPLSKAFRWVSMVSGWLVSLIWLKLTLWVVLTEQPVDTVGFLGTLVGLMPGWWAIFVSVALAILAGWASWGLWPGKRRK
jgi:hypothetical protein